MSWQIQSLEDVDMPALNFVKVLLMAFLCGSVTATRICVYLTFVLKSRPACSVSGKLCPKLIASCASNMSFKR